MRLQEELAAQRERARRGWSAEEREVRLAAVTATDRSGLAEQALGVGDSIPPFVLKNAVGVDVDILELLRAGPLVLSFYRGSWCPYCNLELRALQERWTGLPASGPQLVAISPESPDRSLTLSETHALEFPVLSDPGNRVARSFRIVHEIAPEVVEYQLRNGNDVAAFNGGSVAEVPLPASFVISGDGVIRYAFVKADYTERADADELFAVAAMLARESAEGESQ